MAVEKSPSLFSPSLCLQWEHLAHIAVHLPFVTSVCSVSLGPAVAAKCSRNLAIATPALHLPTTTLSLELAHTTSPCWPHKLLHHNTTAWPGSNPGFSRPEGLPTQILQVTLEILLPCLGEAELAKRLHLSFSPLSTPLTLKALSHLNKPIGSPELREWTVSSYHTNGSLKQILKPREGIKQWVELEASKSIERDKSKITINSLPLFYYLTASKHRLSFLMTLKNLRSHFLSMFELFWDAHIQEQKKASSWCVQCQAALAMWLPLNTSQPKAVALTEDTGAARAAKRAGTCPENRESKGLRTTSSC